MTPSRSKRKRPTHTGWFRLLLLPLENVKQNPKHHPEGDVLFHLLQVFELARDTRAYDEEFFFNRGAAAHDVGKGIDRYDHVRAGLDALDGLITERTAFFIAHHMEALEYKTGTLGHRARKHLGSVGRLRRPDAASGTGYKRPRARGAGVYR